MGVGKHGKEHTLTNLSQSHILKQGGGMEMQDLEKIGKDLLQGANGKALREAAASPEAQRLSRTLDPAEVEQAARSGDPEQLRALLSRVLSTDEGRTLAEKLSRLGF